MDNLERFINNNKEAFDTEVPSLKVWAAIDKELPKQKVSKRISIRRFMSIAAAIALLVSFGIGIGFFIAPSSAEQEPIALSDISPKYAEVEHYYAQQVSTKLAQLASYEASTPEIKADLEELDVWMQDLQKELMMVPKSKEEALVNEIIDLYKTKVAILEKILERIQSSNQKNSNQNDTVDI